MIIIYFRSSSFNAWDFCPHKYYLDYCLGYHSPANKKAQKGCIVHKALELLAKRKLSSQKSQNYIIDTELDVCLQLEEISPDYAVEIAYRYYVEKKEFEYDNRDLDDCRKWVWEVMNWRDGMFSPLNLNIISPEQYFDFEIQEPWAEYSYALPDGRKLAGYLRVKGTIDLVVERPGGVIEVIDWKTGRKHDWSKEKDKHYEDLYNDSQLRIYYWAASRLYPQAKEIFFTIFYIQDGGPHSICFERRHLPEIEEMLKKRFEVIRATQKPKLIYPSWKCSKLCWFGKNSFEGPTTDYQASICNQINNEIIQLGMEKVTATRAQSQTFNSYGSGGGKTHDG